MQNTLPAVSPDADGVVPFGICLLTQVGAPDTTPTLVSVQIQPTSANTVIQTEPGRRLIVTDSDAREVRD